MMLVHPHEIRTSAAGGPARTSLVLLFLILALSLGTQALCQSAADPATPGSEDILFEEIASVFGASKHEQLVSEAPSSVNIVTADEIRKYGYRNLADILKGVRGFYTTYDRNYSYAGIRGFGRPGDYNTRLLILIDGLRTNDSMYNASSIDSAFPVDLDLIDRVEIIRGPSSSLYGTSAFFGVVNVITKRGRDLQGVEVSGELASFDTYKGRLSYGKRFVNGVEVLLSSSLLDSGGENLFFEEFLGSNDGIAQAADYLRYRNFLGKVSYRDFSLRSFYVSRKKGIPTASYGTVFNDNRTFTVDGRMQIRLDYDHVFQNGWELSSQLYWDQVTYEGDYVYDWAEEDDNPDLIVNKDAASGRSWGTDFRLSKVLADRHRLTFGTDFRDNYELEQLNFDVESYLDDSRQSRVYGLFLQDEFQIHPKLLLNAGLRYDSYGFETTDSLASPRLALIYSPLSKTTIKLLFGEAFRAPSAYELYYQDGEYSQKAARQLEPEKIRTGEVVLEHSFGRRLVGSLSLFKYSLRDLINQRADPTDGLLVFGNLDSVTGRGAELELEGRLAGGLEGRFSYSFAQAQDEAAGQTLSNSPRHMAKFNVIFPLFRQGMLTGLEGQYLSSRRTLSGRESGSYLLTNLNFYHGNLFRRWELSFGFYNLFDQHYVDPGFEEHVQDTLRQSGRNLRVKLTYNFSGR